MIELRPGHSPPHVTMAAFTALGSHQMSSVALARTQPSASALLRDAACACACLDAVQVPCRCRADTVCRPCMCAVFACCCVRGHCVATLESLRRMDPSTISFELRKFIPGNCCAIGFFTVFLVRLGPGGHTR